MRGQGVVCVLVGYAADQVADTALGLCAMRWALVLDAPLPSILPAALYIGAIAGARRSRLAAIGAACAFAGPAPPRFAGGAHRARRRPWMGR